MTTVAVIADTHLPRGSRRLPEACLERLRRADAIVHAGDFVRMAVLVSLRALGPPVFAVHGNMDEAQLRAALPAATTRTFELVTVGVVHEAGPRAGRAERLLSSFPGCDAVVYAHTHEPEVARHEGRWILNPGSPTERRRAPAHSMLELRIDGREVVPELVELRP